MKASIFLFALNFLTLATCGRIHNSPELKIQPYLPRGLKVTLPHSPGDHFFTFHANINRKIKQDDVGEIFGETSKKEKGQWVIRNETVKLRFGDKINYWYIVNYHKLMFFKEGSFVVRDFEESNNPDPVEALCPESSSLTCEQLVVNLTNNVLDLQKDVEDVQNLNAILKDMVQKDSKLATSLSLDGLEVSENDVGMVLQAIIKDKMELPYNVKNVQRKSNGKVEFQVSNLAEKLEVIKASKTKLKNSRYVISY